MNSAQLKAFVEADDPIDVLAQEVRAVWSEERFAAARTSGAFNAYIAEGEHRVSEYEQDLWCVFKDVYPMLEAPHARRTKTDRLLKQEEFHLVVFDALSWRELPIILRILRERGLSLEVDYARSEIPSETSDFCQAHFGVSGPTALRSKAVARGWTFELVENTAWRPETTTGSGMKLTWVRYPDVIFALPPATVNYDEYVVKPIQKILGAILASAPQRPLVITGDHGYVWMGGGATWPLEGDEEKLLSEHFKGNRATERATDALCTTDKVYLHGEGAAARGRFAWGARVPSAVRLYKHGGVSLMECLVPWIEIGGSDG